MEYLIAKTKPKSPKCSRNVTRRTQLKTLQRALTLNNISEKVLVSYYYSSFVKPNCPSEFLKAPRYIKRSKRNSINLSEKEIKSNLSLKIFTNGKKWNHSTFQTHKSQLMQVTLKVCCKTSTFRVWIFKWHFKPKLDNKGNNYQFLLCKNQFSSPIFIDIFLL